MKNSQFATVKEKQLVLRAWQRFIKSGFDRKHFTKRLYDHLCFHCSFIAHFNSRVFYATYFRNPEDTITFLRQFDGDFGYRSVELGVTGWFFDEDYHDLNLEMVKSLEPHKTEIYAGLKQEVKEKKLGQIDQLRNELRKLEEEK